MQKNTEYETLSDYFEKEQAFDEIAAMFYERNFATASKAEIELLMFQIYMKAMIKAYSSPEGVVNYQKISDYEIAKQLGIPQTKVRNLKIRSQAKYPIEFDWKKSLLSIKENIRYENKKIIIPVPDPNLSLEIRNFVNQNGGYVDIESGIDYIKIRIEYYLMLMYYTLDENDKKRFLKETKKQLRNSNKNEEIFSEKSKLEIANDVLHLVNEGLTAIETVVGIVSPQNTLANVLHSVLKPSLHTGDETFV